jgi:hypothetical protein
MQPKLKKSRTFFGLALLLVLFATHVAIVVKGQTPANRFLGTITAISPGQLTVKTDAGAERKVTAPDGIQIQRVAPGAKDLGNAATIQFSDLAVGDRVLVRLAPEPITDPVTAISLVAIPKSDLAQKQQQDRDDWQKNGVGGLVKSVDAGTGNIVITSGAGATQKTITLHTTPTTILRRYAPDSVSFDQAKAAPIETIHAGDQLRARGTKNADGTEVAALDVVSGGFRNISGVLSAVNPTDMTISLKDLITKQSVTVHVSAATQMRKLPENMAKILASMTKTSTPGATGVAGSQSAPPAGAAQGSAPGGQQRAWSGTPGTNGGQGGAPGSAGQAGGDWASRRQGGDLQQMLNRAPAIHLADLQKGDAVMLVSTQGSSEVNAVTLLAGVEPLLEAPASTQNMLLSNWNMSSGGADAAQ